MNNDELDKLDMETEDMDDSFSNDESEQSDVQVVNTFMGGSGFTEVDISKMQEEAENTAAEENQDKDKENTLSKENVEYSVQRPQSEEAQQSETKIIDGLEVGVKETKKEKEFDSKPREHVRTYSKDAKMEKIVFRKPREKESIMPKLIMLIGGCIAVGVFLGLQANSYYIYKGGKVKSNLSCVFSWIMEENMPFSMSPINGAVFGTGFLAGACVLGVIGLFIYLDSSTKKQSRVGHEHGSSRIATPKDIKNFRNRFMEK